ncbi:hypothetical protein EVAR_65977_1 [Eumeta japonica]|uniref:Uncharacterized protein n=1 Tax=Eumeta variegata TaxID=151549 RepID=A0A4C1ZX32_EUMVA|nr:hypothetical protein EVAR_65977_1 [Eumeta japonica]
MFSAEITDSFVILSDPLEFRLPIGKLPLHTAHGANDTDNTQITATHMQRYAIYRIVKLNISFKYTRAHTLRSRERRLVGHRGVTA